MVITGLNEVGRTILTYITLIKISTSRKTSTYVPHAKHSRRTLSPCLGLLGNIVGNPLAICGSRTLGTEIEMAKFNTVPTKHPFIEPVSKKQGKSASSQNIFVKIIFEQKNEGLGILLGN